MSDTIRIVCENTGASLFVNQGTSLDEVREMLALHSASAQPFLACYVNNRIKELDCRIYSPATLRFIDITHFEGMRVYLRTFFFILQKAVSDLFPGRKLHIKHSVARGFYCEVGGMEEMPEHELERIRERIRAIIAQDIPIVRQKVPEAEARAMYEKLGFDDKIALLETRPRLYATLYSMADLVGYFYGALAVSTGYVHGFDLHAYYKGFRVAMPMRTDPSRIEELILQDKMFEVFNEYTRWVDVLGVSKVGSLNAKILDGKGNPMIWIAEALHEKSLGYLADRIYARRAEGGARVVLISGPSSSGKTTFAKRLSIQLAILAMHPVMISLDDYFVNRADTPRDENDEYDYEALEAIDVALFNEHLEALLRGEEVTIPKYNFITGEREYHERRLKMDERSVLLVEGIHGLNPNLTPHIDPKMKFKVYISALTSVAMDNLNRISTTDNRLIRRIVRDHRTRGNSAVDTLRRWESVRRGEDKHIFPNQEQADYMFNSSLFYELAVLKESVWPLLGEVPDTVPEYGEARRLLKFLDHFTPLDGREIPPTSILREFIGGSGFDN